MNDRNHAADVCSPGTGFGSLPRAARRRALRALRRRRTRASRPVRFALLGAAAYCAVAGAAEPVYAQRGHVAVDVHQVVSGDVSFRRTRGGLTISASNGSIIEFERFSIPKRGVVRFDQPGIDSAVLNRVVGPEASLIQGTLLANGKVFLVNPSGVTFGPGARVNVGALYAVGGQISNADFRRGINNFTDLTGAVVNEGAISAGRGAHLAGASVDNSGSIVSGRGIVSLSAGDNVFLAERGSSVMVRIDAPGAPGATSAAPAPAPESGVGVRNTGDVQARGVLFSTGDLHSLAIRNEGTVSATGGSVAIDSAGLAHNSGVLDASDRSAGGAGGEVRLLGERVVQDGVIDASGDRAGGAVYIGGSFRGLGPERSAETTVITQDSVIRADALSAGDGGRIAVWGDEGAYVGGEISTRAGQGGAGGFIETSADSLILDARVDAGVGGAFLVDPVNLTIGGGPEADPLPDSGDFEFGDGASSISAATVEAVIGSGGSLVLEAQNNITVSADIDTVGGDADGDLTLRAGRSVIVDANTTIATDANITLQANFYEDGSSAVNSVIAAGRTAGDAAITLNNQVDITAGGELRIEVREAATPLAANGTPVGVAFAVADISLGAAANDAQRVDLAGDTVVISVPNGLAANADITATGSVLLHAGTDGTGTLTFAAAATQSTLDSPVTTLRAGDGAGAEVIDLSTNAPKLANLTSLTIRQDGAITEAGLIALANVNAGGVANLDYTLQSDNGSVTLGAFAKLLDADLTLRTAGDVTFNAAADLGDVLITGLGANQRAGDVTINSAVDLTNGSLEVDSASFTTVATATVFSNTGNVDIDATGDVALGDTVSLNDGSFSSAGAAFTGSPTSVSGDVTIEHTGLVTTDGAVSADAVSITSTGGAVVVGGDVSGSTSIAIAGDGGVSFDAAGRIIASPSVALRATGGASTVDFTNAPLVRGSGASAPTAYTHEQGLAMTEADLLAGAQFDQGAPGAYTLQSGDTITIGDATPLQNTDLTLLAADGVTLGGAAAYTLDGLTIDADTDTDATGDVAINQGVTIASGDIASAGVDFTTSGLDLVADSISFNHTGDVTLTNPGARVTLGDSVIGGSLTLDVTNPDALSTSAIDQVGGSTVEVGAVMNLTAAGAVTAIDLSAADVTGQVRLNTPGDATVVSPGALTLGASTVGGALDATAQDGSLTLAADVAVTGSASLAALGATSDIVGGTDLLDTTTNVTLESGRDITLTRAAGGSYTLDAGRDATLTLTGPTATTFGASMVGRDLSLTSGGALATGAAIDVTRNATLTSNIGVLGLALDFTDLDVGGVLSLTTDSVARVETSAAGGYTLGASNVGVALRAVAQNGLIDGSGLVQVGKGALVVPGATTSLDAQSINLTTLDSAVPIDLLTTGNATITNAGAIDLAGVQVGGAFVATATAGAITDSGATLVTGNATFTATGVGGAITLDAAGVNGATSLSALGAIDYRTAGTLRVQSFSAGADSILEASDINFTGAAGSVAPRVGAVGVDLAIRPSAANLSVGLGDGFGANLQNFTLSATDLTKLADGFASLTIGRTDAFTNSLILGSGVSFSDAVILRRPTDGLTGTLVNAGVSGTDDASITFQGNAGGGLGVAGDIVTQGGAIAINDDFITIGDVSLQSAGGAISAGAISAAAPGADALTVNAGAAGTVNLGAIGAGGAVASFDLQNAGAATTGAVIATGASFFNAASLTSGAVTSLNNQAVTFTTDTLTLGGAVTTQGDLLVQPRTPGRDIGLNVAVGGLDLTGATFTNLFSAVDRNSITIGRANGTGDITVGAGGFGPNNDALLRTPGGEILVDGQIQALADASLTLTAQTVRARSNIFTTLGDLSVAGPIVIELAGVQIGSLDGGAIARTVTLGAIDSAAGEGFVAGGNGATTLVLTGDIGASQPVGSSILVAQSGLQLGAGAVDITAASLQIDGAIDSITGQTNALSITTTGGALITGPVGGAVLANPATVSSLTVEGAIDFASGIVRTTGAQSFDDAVTLTADTLFEASSARFAGGMNGAGLNVDVDGAATLAGGTFTALTLDLLGATRVEGSSTISGGAVRFASTLDGATAGAGSLTLNSDARFEGQVGDTARLGALTAGALTVATDVVDVGALDVNGQLSIESASLTVRGASAEFGVIESVGGANALIANSTASAFTGAVGLGNALGSLSVGGGATIGAGQIRTTGAQTYTGAVLLSSDTTLTSTGAGALDFDSTINGARALTLSTAGLTTLAGDVGQGAALTDLTIAGGARLEGADIAAGSLDIAGATTIANSSVRITGTTARFGGAVASVNGQNNSLVVDASGVTRFDGAIGAGAGALGGLSLGGGGSTTFNGATINAAIVQVADSALVDAPSLTITAGDIRFENTLTSVVGESNALTLNAGATRLAGAVSNLSSLTTDGAGTTTIAASTVSANQITFADDVVITAPTLTVGGGTVRFLAGVDSQNAGASSLTVNAGTTVLDGAVGAGGRLNALTTDGAGTTSIGGAQILANTVTLNDSVVVNGSSLTISASTVALGVMNAGAGVTPDVAINAETLTLSGAVGAGKALGSLTTDAAGTTTINGSVVTTGAQTYNDDVTLAGAVTGGGVEFVKNVTVGAGAAVSAPAGLARFGGAVGGAGDLTVSASTVEFAKAIGALNILGSLHVAGDTTLTEGSVTTSGAQSFDGSLILSSDTTFNGKDVSIVGTLRSSDGAQERTVLINDSGETLLSGDFADLRELRTDAGGRTNLAGDFLAGDFLFADDVVLVGDAHIEATGDSGIAFLGRIDSDATPRSLTLQIDRQAIEKIEAALAPGETLADAIRERLVVDGRPLPTISFGDDIGFTNALAELRLNAEGSRLDPAVYATIIGVRRLENGRVSVTTPINLTINAGRFEMGRNEKFTVLGGLTLNAGAEAILGDLTVAQTLRVNVDNDPASRIVLLVREIGSLLAPAEDADDVLGLVDGTEVLDRVDIVAGGQVLFSKQAELDSGGLVLGSPRAVISGSGGSSGNVLNSDEILFRLFPRAPIALEDLVIRLDDGDVIGGPGNGQGNQPLLFGPGLIDLVLDFSSDGLTLADTSGLEGVTGLFAQTAAGAIEDQVLLSQSVRDRLERVGLSARDPLMSELAQALSGRAYYNDYSSEASASDTIGQYAGEIVVNRLPREAAEALVAQFDSLVGADDERLNAFKAALADAYIAYYDQAPDEMLDDSRLLAAGFATRIASTEAGSEVDLGLRGVAELLRQIEDIGVTRFEYERALQAVLTTFTPDPEMRLDEFRIVVEWYKSRMAGERAAARQSVPAQAPAGAEASS